MNKRQIEKRISLIPDSYINTNYISDTEYLFLLKKTEKIIIATYILTDFIPTEERLKKTLKDNSHEVLNSVCDLLYDRNNRLELVQKIKSSFIKLLTQYSIAEISGFISKMNSDIIKNEINNLIKIVGDLERELSDEQAPEIKNTYFSVDVRNKRQYLKTDESKDVLYKGHKKGQKDTKKDFKDKSVLYTTSSGIGDFEEKFTSTYETEKTVNMSTDSRDEKILDIVKEKKNVSIKDISNLVLDCSEKTIQRALNKLIDQGRLIKKGERRWARYEMP